MAPGLSMAIAATGTPAGICTLDNNASMPESTVVAIGTAITGSVVSAATTPARCAAPPAATMTTFKPRAIAVEAYSCVFAGERWAETTSTSNAIPNLSSIFADSLITGRSVSEPMMIPTTGDASVLLVFSVANAPPLTDPLGQNGFQFRRPSAAAAA